MRKYSLAVFFLLLFFLPLSSGFAANPAPVNSFSITNTRPDNTSPVLKKNKLPLFQRFLYKMITKKIRKKMLKNENTDPDKMAKQANLFGWLGIASLFVFPLLAIPFGIIALSNGSKALAAGTSLPRKAKTGKVLGIISLVLVAVALIIVISVLSQGGL